MNDILDLRKKINEVDEQLVSLLGKRAALAQQIGTLKRSQGSAVYDPDRERTVLERIDVLNTGPLSKGALEEVFAAIMTACREIQLH
jgi:chorismate mutase-like protein